MSVKLTHCLARGRVLTMYTVNSLGFVTAFGQAEYMKGFEMSNAPKKVLLVKMSYEGSFFSTFVHFPADSPSFIIILHISFVKRGNL